MGTFASPLGRPWRGRFAVSRWARSGGHGRRVASGGAICDTKSVTSWPRFVVSCPGKQCQSVASVSHVCGRGGRAPACRLRTGCQILIYCASYCAHSRQTLILFRCRFLLLHAAATARSLRRPAGSWCTAHRRRTSCLRARGRHRCLILPRPNFPRGRNAMQAVRELRCASNIRFFVQLLRSADADVDRLVRADALRHGEFGASLHRVK